MTPLSASAGTVRALICEDEPLAVRAIKEYLKGVDWVEIVGEAREGREAMRLIHKLEPDLVFMDVQMPRLTGVEVLETVTHRPAVVFTTAYDEYAVKAFELGAVDYLVKPFGRERLLECLGRVRVKLVGEGLLTTGPEGGAASGRGEGREEPASDGSARDLGRSAGTPPCSPADRLFARRGAAIVPVPVDEILQVEANDGGSSIHTADGNTLELAMTLGEVETRLDPADFIRVHRAHLVNLAHVVEIKLYDERRLGIRLTDGTRLVASRRGSQRLREAMG